ncbi:MAG: hypothetical protein KBT29_01285 [Prevotellaceae bacterium]|nr:hypothetical protein [Candidatus Minthosoma caballi]
MKNLIKMMTALIVLALGFGIVSCNDDDDKDNPYNSKEISYIEPCLSWGVKQDSVYSYTTKNSIGFNLGGQDDKTLLFVNNTIGAQISYSFENKALTSAEVLYLGYNDSNFSKIKHELENRYRALLKDTSNNNYIIFSGEGVYKGQKFDITLAGRKSNDFDASIVIDFTKAKE